MTVLDTHAWVWWLDDDPRLSDGALAAIDASDELAVSAISVWELATLERLGRLTFCRTSEPGCEGHSATLVSRPSL